MTEHRVVMALPIYGQMPVPAAIHMAVLMQKSAAAGVLSGLTYCQNAMVDFARNQCVENVLEHESEPTHIFWLDGDIVAPNDAIERLLEHDTDIASGLYHRKDPPHIPVVYTLDPFQNVPDFDIEKVQTVEGTGMGCLLVRTQVYKDMAEKYGDRAWHQAMYPTGGEDVWFFGRCKEMGVETIMDPRIRCGHMKETMITTEDWKR
jgi:hypothetical protein